MANVKKWNAFNAPTTTPTQQIDTAAWQQKADEYNQQRAAKQAQIDKTNQTLWQYGYNIGWIQVWTNLPAVNQSTAHNAASTTKSWNPYDAYQIEETIGWNNYYYPNGQLTTQGQENALNWTWHVAWIPQWPQAWLIQPDYSQFQSTWMYVPEQTNTTQAQPTTPKWNW
jgi:hypothetical protein